MANPPYVNESNFHTEVIRTNQPVLVEFTVRWCGPCKMLDPLVTQLAEEWKGKVKVVKLDVDDSPNLVTLYPVMAMPTLILFKSGKPITWLSGYQPKDRIIAKLESYIDI